MAVDTPARIAVLGAGPIGLETALYARFLGYEVDLYERGRVADNIQRWGHVPMFTPFGLNRSPLGLAALRAQDPAWKPPTDDALLTGHEFAASYLLPLAQSDLLADGLHAQTEVLSVGRRGLLKAELLGQEERADYDFQLLLRSSASDGPPREYMATADVVIDTTGTYGNHNWLGPGGLPALGELAAARHIEYGLPDVLGAERARYAGRNVLVVGAGCSAASSVVALCELAAQALDTSITWIARREIDEIAPGPVRGNPDDRFATRQRLIEHANRLAADPGGKVTFWGATAVEAVTWESSLDRFAVRLAGKHTGELEFDRIIANVGHRPDRRIHEQLQVEPCAATEACKKLAATLRNHGALDGLTPQPADALLHPEPDFYILGAKSFGRDPRFLIWLGLEQIRELFTILGDRADLNLYATMKGLY